MMPARSLPSSSLGALLVACFLAAGSARAADDPELWLRRMNDALLQQDYRGEFSYYSGGDLASLRIVHASIDGVQHERLVHLNGHPREILRNGDEVTCLLEPGDSMLEFTESIPSGPFARAFAHGTEMLPAGYQARFGARGRIAGRSARELDVVPNDATRYGYRLWLDDATGMLLRSELIDVDGDLLEIFQFVHVDIGVDIDPAELQPRSDGSSIRHRLTFRADAPPGDGDADDAPIVHEPPNAPAWKPTWLPVGFRMTAADVRRIPESDRALHTLRFTDGLASFSLFVERTWAKNAWDQRRQHGATSAVMREFAVGDDERYLVTVVGEVPMDTAERIVRSVQPVP